MNSKCIECTNSILSPTGWAPASTQPFRHRSIISSLQQSRVKWVWSILELKTARHEAIILNKVHQAHKEALEEFLGVHQAPSRSIALKGQVPVNKVALPMRHKVLCLPHSGNKWFMKNTQWTPRPWNKRGHQTAQPGSIRRAELAKALSSSPRNINDLKAKTIISY